MRPCRLRWHATRKFGRARSLALRTDAAGAGREETCRIGTICVSRGARVGEGPRGCAGPDRAGLIAFALFFFLYLYPLRKRICRLDVHIVAGLVVPAMGAVHAAWRFQGIIGWGYFSMLMVALSGVVGKYLYVHIPRSRNGLALSLEQIVAMTGLGPNRRGVTRRGTRPGPPIRAGPPPTEIAGCDPARS